MTLQTVQTLIYKIALRPYIPEVVDGGSGSEIHRIIHRLVQEEDHQHVSEVVHGG